MSMEFKNYISASVTLGPGIFFAHVEKVKVSASLFSPASSPRDVLLADGANT